MKPTKPYKSFPLTPHSRGWVKKYQGKVHWVASGDTPPDVALRRWHEIVAGLDVGVKPVARESNVTIGRLANLYYTERHRDHTAGRIGLRRLQEIDAALAVMLRHLSPGLPVETITPDHMAQLARHIAAPGVAASTVRRIGGVITAAFRAAADEQWIDRPVAFGQRWRRLVRPRVETKPKPITRDDCHKLLAAVDAVSNQRASRLRLKACILLALNGGYGPAELAQLRCDAVDLAGGWITQRRGKTGVLHVVALWPETVTALREVWPEDREFVFQTRDGRSLAYVTATALHQPLSRQFHRLARLAGVRASFYQLRHTHRSVSGGAGDEAAADVLIGHSLPGMRAVYQSVSQDRLRSVSGFVREWLFGVTVPGT